MKLKTAKKLALEGLARTGQPTFVMTTPHERVIYESCLRARNAGTDWGDVLLQLGLLTSEQRDAYVKACRTVRRLRASQVRRELRGE